jgi:hypothetical protein
MSRCQKDPLRPLTEDECQKLQRLARSGSEPAEPVARAKALLAVVEGHSYLEAARSVGRKSSDAVSQLVARFNREGLSALVRRLGQGAKPKYTGEDRARIVAEVRRQPEPAHDGTGQWSLMRLRRALRTAPEGLPQVSAYTIRAVRLKAGYRWLGSRTWCETGHVVRRRKSGPVTVTDPEAEAKKT